MTDNRLNFSSAGAVRKRQPEGVQPGSHSKVAFIAEDELLDLKRALTLLRAEMHNPGAARHQTVQIDAGRYIAQDIELDRLTDEMVYLIDHALENVR